MPGTFLKKLDLVEISIYATKSFVRTLALDEVSNFSDFGYEEISSEIEELVSESTDLCRLLEEFFGRVYWNQLF
jgi:hypothetical protein